MILKAFWILIFSAAMPLMAAQPHPVIHGFNLADGSKKIKGFEIQTVPAGSLSESIGLRPGDIVKKYNGHEIQDSSESKNIFHDMAKAKKIDLLIERDGQAQILHLRKP